jgi:hypothetical protein
MWNEETLEKFPEHKDFLERYKDEENVAKALVEQRQTISNSIRTPGEGASDDEKQAYIDKLVNADSRLMLRPDPDLTQQPPEFYDMLGVPKTRTDYRIKGDEALVMDALSLFEDAKLTNDQMQSVVDKLSSAATKNIEGLEAQKAADQDRLKKEWGMAYEDKMKKAEIVREKFFPELNDLNADATLGMAKLYDSLDGGGPVVRDQPAPSAFTPAEAKAQIDEIMRNPIYWGQEGTKDQQQELVKRRAELQRAVSAG